MFILLTKYFDNKEILINIDNVTNIINAYQEKGTVIAFNYASSPEDGGCVYVKESLSTIIDILVTIKGERIKK